LPLGDGVLLVVMEVRTGNKERGTESSRGGKGSEKKMSWCVLYR